VAAPSHAEADAAAVCGSSIGAAASLAQAHTDGHAMARHQDPLKRPHSACADLRHSAGYSRMCVQAGDSACASFR
jgi:hypothetical protein